MTSTQRGRVCSLCLLWPWALFRYDGGMNLSDVKAVLEVGTQLHVMSGRLLSLIKRIREHPDDPAPGTWDVRRGAYLRFQETALGATQALQLLASLGTPPSLVGAVWTWPAALRASRHMMDAFNAALAALFEVRLVGGKDAQDSAVAVAETLVRVTHSFPARRGGGDLPSEFENDVQEFNERLVDFVDAARADLQNRDD